ncbi:hypothetical protein [Nitrosomonas supralitoralis]|uniref:Recombinase RecT n=1 Tax=Nitrosomonas supralitoralis TaxID=2116706 RepID=A0A2P7NTW5_9PROT|nr:hypothetical protein [Nitrosomonas supralitoralis]PSJ16914.1 hypothetical protein C7H79_11160 [Nitrosomonas supralitoralis]
MSETSSLKDLKNHQPTELRLPEITPGFGSLQAFELMQRTAKLLMTSTLVPVQYRAHDEKKGPNPNALANCVVALNMSQRMGADVLMVMQNLYVVEGRPSWSSQWIIAAVNGCGRFSPLRFEIKDLGEKSVEYNATYWESREKKTKILTEKIRDKVCVAWAKEKETGERIESPPVSIEMAVKEGWYSKNGSKWKTMDEVMLRYRTASFFGKLYAPELLMGLQSVEEMQDSRVIDASPDGYGGYSVDIDALKTSSKDSQEKEINADIDNETGEILDKESESEPEPEKEPEPEAKSEDPTPEEQARIKQQLIDEANHEKQPRQPAKRASFNLE